MYYVYILNLKKGEFYKGLTKTLETRLKQHELGEVSSTKNKLPFTLIHVEIFKTRKEGRKREIFFKSGYGREVIKEITKYRAGVAELADA